MYFRTLGGRKYNHINWGSSTKDVQRYDPIDMKERRAVLTGWHNVLIKQGLVIWILSEAKSAFFINLMWSSD